MNNKELLRQVDLLSRHDLGYFTERVFNTVSPNDVYEHNWHIDAISEYLRAVERGEIRRLIINMPPRMLKSISVSIAFPAWLLGRNPKEQIIVAAYAKELSLDLSVKCRDVLRSEWYKRIFPDTILKSDQDEKGKFATTAGGQRFATGVEGVLTGMGGNYLIVDDPLDPSRAISDVERKKANEWVSSTFLNRFNDRRTGRMVLVMQRLHSDDTTARMLEIGGCEHLCLPAEFKKKTIIKIGKKRWERERGDVLDEKRLTPDVIEQTKREYSDPFKYEAQMNQNPTPDEGMFFKKEWWQFYEVKDLPKNLKYYGASDYAVSDGDGDWTVHIVVGVDAEDNWYVVDMYRRKVDTLTWASAQVDMMQDFKPLEWFEEAGVIFRSVDPLLRKIMEQRGIYTYRKSVASVSDKETRAQALRGKAAMRKIFLPKDASWCGDMLEELGKFPMGKHDDIVDAMSLFARMMPVVRKASIVSREISRQENPNMITFDQAMKEHRRILRRREKDEGGLGG